MTQREKTEPKGPDPADPFLELVLRVEELDDDDESSEEAERLTQKIWAAIRAAIQSGELSGRE
jgi:hypothetical protein